MPSDRAGNNTIRLSVAPPCDDHKRHQVGCLNCALAVANATETFEDYRAALDAAGWPPFDEGSVIRKLRDAGY